MIPRLPLQESLKPEYLLFLEALAKTPFSGEIRPDFASRLLMSTDNSIYQILPQAVVFPKSEQDLVHLFGLANQEPFQAITFSPRGGGTGTNGQSLSPGIIIDTSKYMNQILEVNLEQGWVRVQPGVVLDQLNAYLKPYKVFFAPSLSPSNRATIGGMINTDACGKGSRIYGRTSNHILELAWVLSDGTTGRSRSIDPTSLTQFKQQPGRLGKIYRQVDEIVTTKRELIEQIFPKMPRFMTGYNLAKVYQEDNFNLNWILAGSEGTLAVITEAKLRLTPIPKYKALLAIHYRCFDDAVSDAENLLELEPEAIETIDEKILELAKQDAIYSQVKDLVAGAQTLNLVEFVGSHQEEIQEKVSKIRHAIEEGRRNNLEGSTVASKNSERPQQAIGYYLAKNGEEIANLWELRKKGVGLLGNTKGERKPIAFIEDTAVPPSYLASYIREFKALLDEYQLDYAIYGHVDVGCLHVRPALDTKVPKDEVAIRELSDKVVALVRKYGGVMWGEHGKGFRSEYTPAFFGEELYQDLRKIKAAFDPDNRLNPGKIVAPFDSSAEVVRVEAPLRGHFDRQVSASVRSEYEVAFSCNGNGACFNFNPDEVMCPSSKVTRDRIHSPKGRASLLREWLRQLKTARPEELARSGNFFVKVWNTLQKTWGVYDYSHEVYAGMHGCLSCKACATQCPIHVDIPEMKAKFLELYYTRYFRPWRDYLIGNIEILASWQSQVPWLANSLTQNPVTRWLIKQSFAAIDPPALSTFTLKQGLAQRQAPEFNLNQLSNLSAAERENSVILLQDAFTSFYEAHLVLDTYDFLGQLGYTVYVAPFFVNGKPLHVKGFLKEFSAIAQKNAEYLIQLGNLELPIIGIEPSIVLTYRDEYVKILDAKATLPRVQLLQEFLVTQLERLPKVATSEPYYLLGHCTEKTIALASQKQWQQVFQAVGIPLILVSVGCCGMAGIYGHEAEHYSESKKIYQMSWGRHIPSSPEERQRFLATGYSCRSQVKRFDGFVPLHPLQVIKSKA
ncbi:MAG: FAD-binding oxidoreductase [Hydrococcus sp. C42_A2020_068]|nr:FAD-binding oxidoreductase [Hydrococcus sp. C42_A2020_068]